MDCSPPGSSVHRIFQARILGGLPFPCLGDLPNPGTEPGSPVLQVDSLLSEPQALNGLNTQREIEGLMQSTSVAMVAWLARR